MLRREWLQVLEGFIFQTKKMLFHLIVSRCWFFLIATHCCWLEEAAVVAKVAQGGENWEKLVKIGKRWEKLGKGGEKIGKDGKSWEKERK